MKQIGPILIANPLRKKPGGGYRCNVQWNLRVANTRVKLISQPLTSFGTGSTQAAADANTVEYCVRHTLLKSIFFCIVTL